MGIKSLLIRTDRLFTEKINHKIEQLRYGKEIDFSIQGKGYSDKKGYIHYQASVFIDKKMMKSLPISEKDSILDIGCGKGKMVFYFEQLGFGRSDGLEFSKELVSCARKNMQILKKKCKIIHADATAFDEYYNYNYFYLFNPFDENIMHAVMLKIEESYLQKPRKITIIYSNPRCHDQIIESGFFHLKHSDENIYRKITGRVYNIYENEG